MNWTRDRSIILSKVCTVLCALVLAALCVLSPWSRLFSVKVEWGSLTVNLYTVTLIAFGVPAYTVMWFLYRLLDNISKERVFVAENVRCLRRISWCCFAAAAVILHLS